MTPLPENCKSLLMSDPRVLQAHTLKDLTIIALDMTITGALAVNRRAADLARQYRGAPEQEPLSQCAQIYVDFITGLQAVVDNVRSSSFRNVYESVNAAAEQPVNCENEFASRGLDSPLIQDNKDLEQKVTLSTNLARLIKNFLGD
ncbi:invertase inhibitor [Carex littledalei]|uniref:Invertase inhibitor n=1 Tax=Carex littledalei TaxID=544730 RepID=A0A833QVF4_9POAL|nr:invertase inhibitor [Carex littledalei]